MKPLKMYHKGQFNDINQKWLDDGTVILTLYRRKSNKYHKIRVKNLYKPNEEEVDIDTGKPIAKRSL